MDVPEDQQAPRPAVQRPIPRLAAIPPPPPPPGGGGGRLDCGAAAVAIGALAVGGLLYVKFPPTDAFVINRLADVALTFDAAVSRQLHLPETTVTEAICHVGILVAQHTTWRWNFIVHGTFAALRKYGNWVGREAAALYYRRSPWQLVRTALPIAVGAAGVTVGFRFLWPKVPQLLLVNQVIAAVRKRNPVMATWLLGYTLNARSGPRNDLLWATLRCLPTAICSSSTVSGALLAHFGDVVVNMLCAIANA